MGSVRGRQLAVGNRQPSSLKMKRSVLILFLVLTINLPKTRAQVMFQKSFGGADTEYLFDAKQTLDGGFIMTGFTLSLGNGDEDIYIVKTDSNGSLIWAKNFGDTGGERGISIEQTADDGFVIAGTTNSFGASNGDAFLLKLDPGGNVLWSKMYGGLESDYASSVQQTYDGGYIVIGNTFSFGVDTDDVYMLKTDATGDTLWTKTYGGPGYETGNCIRQTADSGYIIAGATTSFGEGNADVYLIKTSSTGDTLWAKTFGGINSDVAYQIRQTFEGGYIVVGRTQSFGTGNPHVYLMKFNSMGDTIWTRTFGGNFIDYGKSVEQTSDSGYIIGGTTAGFGAGYQFYLIKVNTEGDTVWTKTFITQAECNSVKQTSDGGYMMAGYSSFQSTDYNFFLIKTDENGNSGCNEANPPSQIFPWSCLVSGTSSILSSTNTISLSPFVGTGNGGSENIFCCSVEITSLARPIIFSISPNPTSERINIKMEKSHIESVEIYSMLGENMYTKSAVNCEQLTVSCELFLPGIYFVRAQTSNSFEVQKLIKE